MTRLKAIRNADFDPAATLATLDPDLIQTIVRHVQTVPGETLPFVMNTLFKRSKLVTSEAVSVAHYVVKTYTPSDLRHKFAKSFGDGGGYVCDGDTIQGEFDGFTITARIEHDNDSNVDDSECYSAEQIAAWRADEWHFVGVVLSVERNGVMVSNHAASLWGIECNFTPTESSKLDNSYLTETANELLSEALDTARADLKTMREKLA